MRIALIAPYSIGPRRGNITTVSRISRLLRQAGAELLVLPADAVTAAEMEQQLTSFTPQLLHGFHARYCGGLTRHLAANFNVPSVLTFTGSDVYDPLLRKHPDTITAIEAASAVVCFHESEAAEVVRSFPLAAKKITVIAQSIEELPVNSAVNFGFAHDAFVLLLPAAFRLVKQIEFPLLALKSLADQLPAIRLVIAGGIIDQDYAATIRCLLDDAPFATWLGEIPREQMGALYTRADVVLNCSHSESMPNTLLEAMALGRPVLASDIPGNRTVVQHGDTGLLYHDQESFRQCVIRLAMDAELRDGLGGRAAQYMRTSFSPQAETAAHLRLYHALI
ncbi:MAG TPA: glycosyltransferase family 4 protein [Desulfuromonadales bacterium]|nr:glycosyltransferase family 4 protein [Desulfuromonadales bacterium]